MDDDDGDVLRAMFDACATLVPVGVGSTPRICICGFSDYAKATAIVDDVAHPFLRAWYGSYTLLPVSYDPFFRNHDRANINPELVTKADVYFLLHQRSEDRDQVLLAASSASRYLAISRSFPGDDASRSTTHGLPCVYSIDDFSCHIRPELAAALCLSRTRSTDASRGSASCCGFLRGIAGNRRGARGGYSRVRESIGRDCASCATLALSHVGIRLDQHPAGRVRALVVTQDDERAAQWARIFSSIDVPCARCDGTLSSSSGPWWLLVVHSPSRIRDGDGTSALMYALLRSLCAHSPCTLTSAYFVSLFPGAFDRLSPASPSTRTHQIPTRPAPAAAAAAARAWWRLACKRMFALGPLGVSLFDTPEFMAGGESRFRAVFETWQQVPSRVVVLGNPLLNSPC